MLEPQNKKNNEEMAMAHPDIRTLVVTDSPAAALYQPGRIGTLQLRNRFVQAPIFTQFASTFGEVDDKLIEYHRARARGGVGLIITENTSIDWDAHWFFRAE
jgi:2,4-dienoyl-CoA reductase-like NADH-dependent reductase (Old Yellow Enzyme family)